MSLQDEYQMLSRMACDKVKSYIAEKQLKPGDRLPTERDLAYQLEVSRPVIREALGTLEGLGIISRRQGKGTFLQDPNFNALFHEMMSIWQQDSQSLEQVLQFRVLLEQAAVAPIIENARAEDYEKLLALIDQSEQEETTVSKFIQLDYLFHRDLLRLTGNVLFIQLTDVVNRYFLRISESELPSSIMPGIPKTIRKHRKIVQSLQKQDKECAAKWIKRHLTGEG